MISRVFYSTLLFTFISNSLTFSLRANSQDYSSEQCRIATQTVVKEIGSFGTPVYLGIDRDANKYHTGNPTARQQQFSIILGNLSSDSDDFTLVYPFESKSPQKMHQTIENILNSPVLQQKWSNTLAQNCSDLAAVDYSLANTDWMVEYAIQSNGTMIERKCSSSEASNEAYPLPWDERFCF